MTRVLVVHHDIDMADIQVEALRHAGYDVDQCAGPIGGSGCPALRGEPCWQVDRADVLVYDSFAYGNVELLDYVRQFHPDKPYVLSGTEDLAGAVASALKASARQRSKRRVTPHPEPVHGRGW